ncbi:MAG: helix-turn-helix domain-containing protein, partial [Candidatus Bathyarchaeota archaeon]
MSAKQISKQEDQKGTPPPPTEGLELLSTRKRLKTRNITEEEVQHLRYLRRIKEALSKFDLSKNEIRVYIYLARFGVHKAQRIAEALSIHRTEAYKILRRLEKQGLVTCVFERPMKFLSVPFEKALRGLIEERRQKVHQMEQWKKELLRMWRSLPEPEEKKIRKETFQVLEGRRQVGVKATDLLKECNTEIHMILKDEVLLWLFNSPFFEDLEEIVEEKGVKVMLLTNYSPTSTYVMDEINLGEGDFNYKEIEDVPS